MDIKKFIILIKGEDKTSQVEKVSRDLLNKKVLVRYYGNDKRYSYSDKNVIILKRPKIIELGDRIAYLEDMPLYDPQCVLDFRKKIRIIQHDGKSMVVEPEKFRIVKNSISAGNADQILGYLRDIAQYTDTLSEESFLKQELDRLDFVHPESVLGKYLLKKPIIRRSTRLENVIFPFSFNLSQKAALEQAFKNSISIIEGPPGTGKTQTILNILANLVVSGQSVAVVSSNNEAVKNVIQKMQKKDYDFLAALLGKKKNQEEFFSHMPRPKVRGWDCEETEDELLESIRKKNTLLMKLMNQEKQKAGLEQELRAWRLEEEHFEAYFDRQEVEEISKLPLLCRTPERILSFLAESSVAEEYQQTKKLLYRIKLLFKFGIFDIEKLDQQETSLLLTMQRKYYKLQIQRLENRVEKLNRKLEKNSFEDLKREQQEASEKLFRKYLYKRYYRSCSPAFTKRNYKLLFENFIKTYPILLSTTYSLRHSIPQNYLLDYVIIDESSQVDLITGVLAFSCCKNVIIVGDLKQLPQITDKEIKDKIRTSPPGEEYDYFTNNILSSVIAIYGKTLPCVVLREHYRCHPSIIEFCNQKYYNGQLITYTKSDSIDSPLILYKTAEGNHMRRVTRGEDKGTYNQRELDVIVEEVLNNPKVLDRSEEIGVVTPYRKQANKAAKLLTNSIQSDTVHKYQGREKNTIIMSTVLDSSWSGQRGLSFVDDPQMVNVAVSRAIRQFILVTDHDLFFKKGKHIGDLIRYMQYSTLDENVVESQIVSVFDLLYKRYSAKLLPLKAKMDSKARVKSEEALRVLLEEILEQPDYSRYEYTRGMLLQNLLNDTKLLTKAEAKFVVNRGSLDFVIFYKQDKSCKVVVEVDGFAFHENNPEQLKRDAMKDSILKKYHVPLLRLATNGSMEKRKLEEVLGD